MENSQKSFEIKNNCPRSVELREVKASFDFQLLYLPLRDLTYLSQLSASYLFRFLSPGTNGHKGTDNLTTVPQTLISMVECDHILHRSVRTMHTR